MRTVVENNSVKVVITKNEFKKYVSQRYGRSEENKDKNIRVDENDEEEVKIKKVNIFG